MRILKEELLVVTAIVLAVVVAMAVGDLRAGLAVVALAFGIRFQGSMKREEDEGGGGK